MNQFPSTLNTPMMRLKKSRAMASIHTGFTPAKSTSVPGGFTTEYPQRKPLNTMAIIAFVVALCSIWANIAPAALMLGTIASVQINRTQQRGSFFAEFAIIVGTVATVLMVVLAIWEMITGLAG
jgi:hypothetical protein